MIRSGKCLWLVIGVLFPAIFQNPAVAGSTYLTDKNTYQVPNIPRPVLRTPFVDAVFGSTVTRWTDPSMLTVDPNPSAPLPAGLRHEYDRCTAFNCNNTMVALMALGGTERGAFFVYELATGTRVMSLPGFTANGPSITWSRTDPHRGIYYSHGEIDTFNTATKTSGALVKFPQYEYTETAEEGIFSDDWHYAAFFGFKPGANWAKADLCVANLQTKTVTGTISDVTVLPNWIGISPSGKYAVAMFDDYTKLYDTTMTFIRNLFPGQSHSDFAFDQNGDECICYFCWSAAQCADYGDKNALGKVRLRDGQKTMVADCKWKWGSHLSGLGTRTRPGWLLVSSYTQAASLSVRVTNDGPFEQEVLWLKMDGSGQVKRIAHHHSVQEAPTSTGGDKDYFAEPHTASSWDATVVGFCSVWGTPETHYDFYTVTGNWWDDVPIRLNPSMKSDNKAGLLSISPLLNGVDFSFNLARVGDYTVNVYDASGKRIWNSIYQGKIGLNNVFWNRQSAQIRKGVYFINITQGNNNTSGKFIISK